MKKVLVVGRIHDAGMAILNGHDGLAVEVLADPGVTIPVDKAAESDAILIRYGVLTEAHVARAERLRVVSRHGVGCDNLPVAALSARGIPVTIVGPVNAVSVAEQTMAMMLALAKRLVTYDRAVRSGDWAIRDSLGAGELAGKTLLLLGFGRIGREVARRACAFDMTVAAYDPLVSGEAMAQARCRKVEDWRAELDRVDVVSLHLPLTSETAGLIDAGALARLKPTAILLNAARGGLVDEKALASALRGRMAPGGAGLDTFAEEPLSPDSPLLALPNVIVSPHSAALTEEAARRMAEVATQNVIGGLDGRLDPALIFNRAALLAKEHQASDSAEAIAGKAHREVGA